MLKSQDVTLLFFANVSLFNLLDFCDNVVDYLFLGAVDLDVSKYLGYNGVFIAHSQTLTVYLVRDGHHVCNWIEFSKIFGRRYVILYLRSCEPLNQKNIGPFLLILFLWGWLRLILKIILLVRAVI